MNCFCFYVAVVFFCSLFGYGMPNKNLWTFDFSFARQQMKDQKAQHRIDSLEIVEQAQQQARHELSQWH